MTQKENGKVNREGQYEAKYLPRQLRVSPMYFVGFCIPVLHCVGPKLTFRKTDKGITECRIGS